MKRAPFAVDETVLLSREEFKRQVFQRSRGRCVLCGCLAVDAHHVMERKLFADHGYYLGNGAAVCEQDHWRCETTEVSLDDVRKAAGIAHVVLPPGYSTAEQYDKWGNRVWPSGLRTWGPLETDSGARKALAAGGYLGRVMPAGYSEDGPNGCEDLDARSGLGLDDGELT